MNIQGMVAPISAPLQAQAAGTNAASSAGNSGSSITGSSSSDLQSMFLNLLVTELQNQDPTQPVDPTQMVGQMISLNQLDQLISINQTLSGLNGSTNGSAPAQTASGASSTSAPAAAQAAAIPLAFQTVSNGGSASGLPMSLYNLLLQPVPHSREQRRRLRLWRFSWRHNLCRRGLLCQARLVEQSCHMRGTRRRLRGCGFALRRLLRAPPQ